eukprot:6190737-Pleurochrysis_carterae.AAC.6
MKSRRRRQQDCTCVGARARARWNARIARTNAINVLVCPFSCSTSCACAVVVRAYQAHVVEVAPTRLPRIVVRRRHRREQRHQRLQIMHFVRDKLDHRLVPPHLAQRVHDATRRQ